MKIIKFIPPHLRSPKTSIVAVASSDEVVSEYFDETLSKTGITYIIVKNHADIPEQLGKRVSGTHLMYSSFTMILCDPSDEFDITVLDTYRKAIKTIPNYAEFSSNYLFLVADDFRLGTAEKCKELCADCAYIKLVCFIDACAAGGDKSELADQILACFFNVQDSIFINRASSSGEKFLPLNYTDFGLTEDFFKYFICTQYEKFPFARKMALNNLLCTEADVKSEWIRKLIPDDETSLYRRAAHFTGQVNAFTPGKTVLETLDALYYDHPSQLVTQDENGVPHPDDGEMNKCTLFSAMQLTYESRGDYYHEEIKRKIDSIITLSRETLCFKSRDIIRYDIEKYRDALTAELNDINNIYLGTALVFPCLSISSMEDRLTSVQGVSLSSLGIRILRCKLAASFISEFEKRVPEIQTDGAFELFGAVDDYFITHDPGRVSAQISELCGSGSRQIIPPDVPLPKQTRSYLTDLCGMIKTVLIDGGSGTLEGNAALAEFIKYYNSLYSQFAETMSRYAYNSGAGMAGDIYFSLPSDVVFAQQMIGCLHSAQARYGRLIVKSL